MNYTHQAKSIDEQIRLLRRRGLKISNPRKAKEQLACISYFRLACYLRHLEIDANHTYKPGTTFAQTISLFTFLPAPTRRQKLYSQLTYLAYLDQSLTPTCRFASKLKRLIKRYPNTDLSAMGFPTNWQDEPLWQ